MYIMPWTGLFPCTTAHVHPPNRTSCKVQAVQAVQLVPTWHVDLAVIFSYIIFPGVRALARCIRASVWARGHATCAWDPRDVSTCCD
ncbi:uncharacterized protein BJ212DRAFT_86282 [Suillus subaureus]|uniref:Uncharacterized protein n=1 Tax=Suillus subaureus TaxID=48587 RepID=A0A9P7DRA0_9AGAM|nr:uncharacterized protein BJ212DRAFT_86282 [Suillus subaureus]KAG1801153.1 hypothetical protein BJ212DRAFT_86282 [Suillus subaureus]